MGFRIAAVILFFTLLYTGLVSMLYNLQIVNGGLYAAKAASQLKLAGLLEPVRGNIYFTDKRGSLILAAMNKPFPFVFAAPKDIEDGKEAAEILAPIVGKPRELLAKALSDKSDIYEPLIARPSEAQLSALKEANINGVYVDEHQSRFYPLNSLGSQVIGFVSTADAKDARPVGQYGIERFYNDELFGKEGSVTGDSIVRSQPGDNIKLTIDRNIQDRGEEIIKNLIAEYRAESGSFIVEDPKTGKILAMGGYPSFDPNNYSAASIKNFLNPNLQEVYEPGSVFKVLTMAAGIDSDSITPDTTYYDSGSLTLNGRTVRNWDLKSYGTVTMTGVIERSLNTGAAFAERKMGHQIFRDYLGRFGFKELTGIDLPGERMGSLAPLEGKNARDINFATASYGQGISVTPLQLINAVSAIANHGIMMRPFINEAAGTKTLRRVISEAAASKVAKMMVSAVDKATIAKINGYEVAGKTGTAFIPNFGHGGYTDQVINTYVGFAPATDPAFTILIKLVKPEGAPLAGLTVVPAFRELAEFLLNYFNSSPDRADGLNR